MAEYGRGIKAGLLTGIIYGVIWSLIVYFGLPALLGLPISNPEIAAFWSGLALPLFVGELIWCVILGLIVGLIVGLLGGSLPKSSMVGGIIAGIIYWVILFISDFVLIGAVFTIGLYTIVEFIVTIFAFGILFGIFWKMFAKK
nr:hypothetical protein [Candidatus Njordarchaeum guaymaensis]